MFVSFSHKFCPDHLYPHVVFVFPSFFPYTVNSISYEKNFINKCLSYILTKIAIFNNQWTFSSKTEDSINIPFFHLHLKLLQ